MYNRRVEGNIVCLSIPKELHVGISVPSVVRVCYCVAMPVGQHVFNSSNCSLANYTSVPASDYCLNNQQIVGHRDKNSNHADEHWQTERETDIHRKAETHRNTQRHTDTDRHRQRPICL